MLRAGPRLPALAAEIDVSLPSPDEPVIAFEVDLEPGEGGWLVLRVSDPSQPADSGDRRVRPAGSGHRLHQPVLAELASQA